MGKINGCLKCLFIFFNVLFAIFGCLLIYGTVKVTAYSFELSALGSPSLGWMWLFAIGVLGISSLGIYAGCSENALALKIFAGFMLAGMVIMMIFGIVIVVARNKVKELFDSASSELVKPFMEDEGMKEMLKSMQLSAHCCGVVSPNDWGNDIPQSCECKSGQPGVFGGTEKCTARPQGTTGPDNIYEQTCSDLIYMYIHLGFGVAMGFFFGCAVTALLGLLVSLLMIHQINRHDTSGASIAMKGY